MKIYPFQQCRAIVWSIDYMETEFDDGRTCPALFIINDENRATAKRCGYVTTDDGVRQMHRDHELGHTFISEAMGRPFSRVLRRVALNEPWSYDADREFEESLVLAFQTFLNTDISAPHLDACFGRQVPRMAREFSERFR